MVEFGCVYISGVVDVCRLIEKEFEKVFIYIMISNFVVIVMDGMVIFGFGNIGFVVGMFVMEGKVVLFD